MRKTRLLNTGEVKRLIYLDEINEIVAKNYIDYNEVKNPSKVTLHLGDDSKWPEYEGFLNAMPAYVGYQDVAGLKWVGGFDGERKEVGLPYITALILIANPRLGTFDTIMDGTVISNLRTGAQAPAALSALKVEKGSKIRIGIYGKGVQASFTLAALNSWYDIESIKFWNHREAGTDEFIEEISEKIDVEPVFYADPEEICKDVDIVITATKSTKPIVEKEWVEPDTIIIPLGSHNELSNELILSSDYIYTDNIEQAASRAALAHAFKEGVIDKSHIDATFSELFNNEKEMDDLEGKIAIAVPVGLGAHDIAIAGQVSKRAEEENVGILFDFSEE